MTITFVVLIYYLSFTLRGRCYNIFLGSGTQGLRDFNIVVIPRTSSFEYTYDLIIVTLLLLSTLSSTVISCISSTLFSSFVAFSDIKAGISYCFWGGTFFNL
jgi:hypothetical protein